MTKRILMACLAALAFSAQANPIPMFDVQFDVTAVAVTDGAPGFDSQSSPPSATPISASADSVGATDIATAGAIAGPGLLSTSADVSATSGIASAVATAQFAGSFLSSGQVTVNIDFTASDFADGSGGGATSLFVSLMNDGATLFEDYVLGPWQFVFLGALGSTSLLALTLSSDVSAGFLSQGAGGAFSSGLVSFSVVPAPATWLLVLMGLGALAALRRSEPRGLAVG